ncbi:MAG: hypothetical protein Homavirus11_11 [Homavirus sp.]|uniref:Uncharacterized protein n=1 Tax=Homavirus sp. TaxID=2487769 RepID=A0A3G5A4K0_9VIRU|nr:MAG: hypothetical protein Homavirus11_11 [Homavirus sp.]
MYNKCYNQYSSNYILKAIPNDVAYSNYIVFYKKNTDILQELDKYINTFKNKNAGKCLVYSSCDKELDLTGGILYDIRTNLTGI